MLPQIIGQQIEFKTKNRNSDSQIWGACTSWVCQLAENWNVQGLIPSPGIL